MKPQAIRRTATGVLAAALAAMLALPAAQAQERSVLEDRLETRAGPDTYYFFDNERKMVLDYKSEHMVRVCIGESRHLVPLKITYDGSTTEIGTNDCVRVEAQEIYLEPAEPLADNTVIRAEVETLN